MAAAQRAYRQAVTARDRAVRRTAARLAARLSAVPGRAQRLSAARAAALQRVENTALRRWENLAALARAREAAAAEADEGAKPAAEPPKAATGAETGNGLGGAADGVPNTVPIAATQLIEAPQVETVAAAEARRVGRLALLAAARQALANPQLLPAVAVEREGDPKADTPMALTGLSAIGLSGSAALAWGLSIRSRRRSIMASQVV